MCLLDSLYYDVHYQLIRDGIAFLQLYFCCCSMHGPDRLLGGEHM